jgi:hypothetical protein
MGSASSPPLATRRASPSANFVNTSDSRAPPAHPLNHRVTNAEKLFTVLCSGLTLAFKGTGYVGMQLQLLKDPAGVPVAWEDQPATIEHELMSALHKWGGESEASLAIDHMTHIRKNRTY